MDNLAIEKTKYTPEINLDANGTFSLVGKSFPENTFEFYRPVMDWVKNYFETSAAALTTVNIEISYLNSSSSKLFFDFFDVFDENKEEHEIKINWIYGANNESAEEAGEDFKEDFENLNFELISK